MEKYELAVYLPKYSGMKLEELEDVLREDFPTPQDLLDAIDEAAQLGIIAEDKDLDEFRKKVDGLKE